MKKTLLIKSDYGSLHTKYADFYYGYERTDENNDWCFVANFDGVEIVISSAKLGVSDKFNISECLLIGIGWIIEKYDIKHS